MYQLPATLSQDIDKFHKLTDGYLDKSVGGVEFKAFRVPMGVYEQRKSEVYMARVRATGGFITPSQLLALIDTAQRNGSNLLHITTRAEIQIHNLELTKVEDVLRDLQAVGLATKGGGGNTVRNILVSEFSGIDKDETFDCTPYAMALTTSMIAEQDSYLMPRKMKIAFSSNEHRIDYAGINDIGLVAQIKDGKRGFKVYVGGGAGSKPSVGWLYKDFIPAEDLYALVKAMKNFFNANGNRKNKHQARIRYIFYRLGPEETFKLIDAEFEKQKAEGKRLDVDLSVHDHPDYASVILPFRLGNISLEDKEKVERLKDIIKWAEKLGDYTLRFTTNQNIRFRNIPLDKADELKKLIADYEPDDAVQPAVLNNIVSCTGADTCRLGICLSKGLARAIYDALRKSGIELSYLADARINITGCPNLCGQPLWSDLGFVGKVLHSDHTYPAYQIYAGANYEDNPQLAQYVGTVSAHDVPKFVVDLVRRFADLAEIADALGQKISFGRWLRTDSGRKYSAAIAAKYKNVPLFTEDKNYYFDWGGDTVFEVTQHGKPECSAGLFDMIGVDQDSIKAARGKDTYKVIFHASRMLLVTRGLDPQTPAEVFDAFVANFIDTGYVDESFKSLVLKAKEEGPAGDYSSDGEKAGALADSVIELYKGMDDALQFKKPGEKASVPEKAEDTTAAVNPGSPSVNPGPTGHPDTGAEENSDPQFKVTRYKDLRGVQCPMNFVRTKLELATLKSGDVLEITLDDGQPIKNVPGSVKLEGHTILRQEQNPDTTWDVVIKKK